MLRTFLLSAGSVAFMDGSALFLCPKTERTAKNPMVAPNLPRLGGGPMSFLTYQGFLKRGTSHHGGLILSHGLMTLMILDYPHLWKPPHGGFLK